MHCVIVGFLKKRTWIDIFLQICLCNLHWKFDLWILLKTHKSFFAFWIYFVKLFWSVSGTHIFHVRFRDYSPSLLRHLCLSLCLLCNCSAISWHFLFRPDGIKTLIYNKNYSVYPSYSTCTKCLCRDTIQVQNATNCLTGKWV